MTGYKGKDVGEPSLQVEALELGGGDERVDDGWPLTATVRTAEQPVASSQGHAAQRPFRCIVSHLWTPLRPVCIIRT